jgi:hypothetical protein
VRVRKHYHACPRKQQRKLPEWSSLFLAVKVPLRASAHALGVFVRDSGTVFTVSLAVDIPLFGVAAVSEKVHPSGSAFAVDVIALSPLFDARAIVKRDDASGTVFAFVLAGARPSGLECGGGNLGRMQSATGDFCAHTGARPE